MISFHLNAKVQFVCLLFTGDVEGNYEMENWDRDQLESNFKFLEGHAGFQAKVQFVESSSGLN